jgi:hypothetical protein
MLSVAAAAGGRIGNHMTFPGAVQCDGYPVNFS